ncbi:hypothetical protein [Pontivivens nitratireducens]|uniref:hypothetical protein n=1 Tax=Pontivivens nitratireducens TaxID=2758038 RepID=UPI001F10FD48|nr:hypothetical protein [Pontibrevibacter nitratireducens]
MQTTLTPLERDLLTCVERLTTSCEALVEEMSGLEARATSKTEMQISCIADCVSLLMRSQTASMKALRGLLSEEASFSALDKHLQESLRLAKSAEKKLKQS